MVIGKDFVWAHFGKTGGSSILEMFKLLSIDLIYDDHESNKKHFSFTQKQEEINLSESIDPLLKGFNKKDKLLGFRRLPYYLVSNADFKAKNQNLFLPLEKLKEGFCIFQNSNLHHADYLLSVHSISQVKHFIRTEYVAEDFIKTLSQYTDIDSETRNQILLIREGSFNNTENKVNNLFSKEDLVQIYNACPIWTEYEEKLYGSLLI
jgi:hypothetical protein